MKKKVKCIMLIDDNSADNFFHERVIKETDAADIIIVKQSALGALEYLRSEKHDIEQSPPPDLIFLDINMPKMNGWEFIEEYKNIPRQPQKQSIIVMLTTSEDPADIIKARLYNDIADFKLKPLTEETLKEILEKHFEH